jgi:hypothetical protein
MLMTQRAVLPRLHRATAGPLFGAQVVVAAAVVPMSRRLAPGQYVAVHTLFTRYADAFLPLLGGTTTVVSYLRYRRDGRVADLVATGALVAAGVAGSRNLATNARVAALDAETGKPGARGLDVAWLASARARWARLHQVRLAGGAVAFAAALADDGARIGFGRPTRPARPALLDLPAAVVVAVVARDTVRHLRLLRAGQRRDARISEPVLRSMSATGEASEDEGDVLS